MAIDKGHDNKIPTDIGQALKGDLDKAADNAYLFLSENIRLTREEEHNIKRVILENSIMFKLEIDERVNHDIRAAEEKVQAIINFEKEAQIRNDQSESVTQYARKIMREIDQEIEGNLIKSIAKQYAGFAALGVYDKVPDIFKEFGEAMSKTIDEVIERAQHESLLWNETKALQKHFAEVTLSDNITDTPTKLSEGPSILPTMKPV
ncbi:MAG: hypothetical protein KDI11_06630 [Alphaproteobacteria bacterium]|nr:hypothetical protein [Alphaproteobacteria bacterium]